MPREPIYLLFYAVVLIVLLVLLFKVILPILGVG